MTEPKDGGDETQTFPNGSFKVFGDGGSVQKVATFEELNNDLSKKTEIQLRQEAYFSSNHQNNDFKNAGLAAQMELERRAADEAQNRAKTLAFNTTILSAGLGILGTLLGILLGWWLNS